MNQVTIEKYVLVAFLPLKRKFPNKCKLVLRPLRCFEIKKKATETEAFKCKCDGINDNRIVVTRGESMSITSGYVKDIFLEGFKNMFLNQEVTVAFPRMEDGSRKIQLTFESLFEDSFTVISDDFDSFKSRVEEMRDAGINFEMIIEESQFQSITWLNESSKLTFLSEELFGIQSRDFPYFCDDFDDCRALKFAFTYHLMYSQDSFKDKIAQSPVFFAEELLTMAESDLRSHIEQISDVVNKFLEVKILNSFSKLTSSQILFAKKVLSSSIEVIAWYYDTFSKFFKECSLEEEALNLQIKTLENFIKFYRTSSISHTQTKEEFIDLMEKIAEIWSKEIFLKTEEIISVDSVSKNENSTAKPTSEKDRFVQTASTKLKEALAVFTEQQFGPVIVKYTVTKMENFKPSESCRDRLIKLLSDYYDFKNVLRLAVRLFDEKNLTGGKEFDTQGQLRNSIPSNIVLTQKFAGGVGYCCRFQLVYIKEGIIHAKDYPDNRVCVYAFPTYTKEKVLVVLHKWIRDQGKEYYSTKLCVWNLSKPEADLECLKEMDIGDGIFYQACLTKSFLAIFLLSEAFTVLKIKKFDTLEEFDYSIDTPDSDLTAENFLRPIRTGLNSNNCLRIKIPRKINAESNPEPGDTEDEKNSAKEEGKAEADEFESIDSDDIELEPTERVGRMHAQKDNLFLLALNVSLEGHCLYWMKVTPKGLRLVAKSNTGLKINTQTYTNSLYENHFLRWIDQYHVKYFNDLECLVQKVVWITINSIPAMVVVQPDLKFSLHLFKNKAIHLIDCENKRLTRDLLACSDIKTAEKQDGEASLSDSGSNYSMDGQANNGLTKKDMRFMGSLSAGWQHSTESIVLVFDRSRNREENKFVVASLKLKF